jgi:hypothetical protein
VVSKIDRPPDFLAKYLFPRLICLALLVDAHTNDPSKGAAATGRSRTLSPYTVRRPFWRTPASDPQIPGGSTGGIQHQIVVTEFPDLKSSK